MSAKRPRHTLDRNRLVVRAGPLEQKLAELNDEMGQRVALLFDEYNQKVLLKVLLPLIDRLDWLEKPLVVRAWIHCAQAWTWIRSGKGRVWLKARLVRTPVDQVPIT